MYQTFNHVYHKIYTIQFSLLIKLINKHRILDLFIDLDE